MGAHFGARATTGLANPFMETSARWPSLSTYVDRTSTLRRFYPGVANDDGSDRPETNDDLESAVLWHLRKSERFRPRGHWCTLNNAAPRGAKLRLDGSAHGIVTRVLSRALLSHLWRDAFLGSRKQKDTGS